MLLLALAPLHPLLAQGRAGRGSMGGRRGPPAVDAATQGLVQALLNTARAQASAAPALAAPVILADLARDEARLFPQQASADDTTAFRLARALPSPDPTTPGAGALAAIKARIELEAVQAIARQRSPAAGPSAFPDAAFDDALQLARRADVPKAPIYDALIMLAAQRGARADEVMAWAQECARSDGTYPYRGLASALRSRRLDESGQLQLAAAGLSYLGQVQDAGQDTEALFFLQALRRVLPQLQPRVDAAITAIAQSAADPGVAARATALLASARADAPGSGLAAPVFSFSAMVVAPLPSDADSGGEVLGASAFLRLVHRAQMQAAGTPAAALASANQAAGMLTPALATAAPVEVATLASVYSDLGAMPDAARVLSLALDAADRLGRAADDNFALADAATRAAQVEQLDSNAAAVIDVYSLAARLDPSTAALRAEASPMVLYKALVLSRLALLAQFPPRPLPVRRAAVLP